MAKYDIQAGDYNVEKARFAIVAARFNDTIVSALLGPALATLKSHGVAEEDITVVRVPGAFELPVATQRIAQNGGVDAVITLGAVIRGDTPHFDYVAGQCAAGLSRAALDTGLPIIFGVLTVDDMDQALARCGGSAGNKGHEAALAGLEMVSLFRRLGPR